VNRCIVLLIDGLRPDLLESRLAAGSLPSLARLAASGGLGRAITAFPSTTSVSYLPFLTGCLPGRCDIPSIRWLDRRTYRGNWWRDRNEVRSYCGYQAGLLDQDLSPQLATLFELVPESAGFFTLVSRGLDPARDPAQSARRFWGALSHYLLWHQPGDDAVSRHLLRWIERDRSWRFLFAQFPAVDGYTHQSDPHAPRVIEALRRVDRTIGGLIEQLERQEILHDTLIMVVSDHGAARVGRHLDLAEWFRAQGVPTLSHPEIWRRNPRAAVMVAGNGSAMVYARPGESRPGRWPLSRLRQPSAFGVDHDVIGDLVAEEAVAFVAGENAEGGITVLSQGGIATIRQVDEQIEYRPASADPLELGGPITADHRGLLAASFDSAYPDAVVQLLDQFRSARTGDLVVVAREGFDFRDRWEIPEHKSGHGSLIRAHMQTPLLANRPLPEVPLRTADLFATAMFWLGEPIPAGIDGELVWAPARAGLWSEVSRA
jgi:hypothetical protein